MEAGQRISAEIGLKTAGGARDTDSDTNWRGGGKGVGRRERRRAGESRRDEQTRLRRGDCEELNATLPTDTQQRGEGGHTKHPPQPPLTQLTMDCSTSSIPPQPTSHPSNTINGLPLRCSKKKTILLEGRAQKKKKKIPPVKKNLH